MIHDEPIDCVVSGPIINALINISARQLENRPFASTAACSRVLRLPGAVSQRSGQQSGERERVETQRRCINLMIETPECFGAALIGAPAAALSVFVTGVSCACVTLLRWRPHLSPCRLCRRHWRRLMVPRADSCSPTTALVGMDDGCA